MFRIVLGLLVAWDLWGRFELRSLVWGTGVATDADIVQEGLLTPAVSGMPWSPWNWSLLWIGQLLESLRSTLALPAESSLDQQLLQWQEYANGPEFANAILIAGIVLALLYAAGLFTRVSNILLWIVVVSVQVRMPLLTTGADTLTRLFLFWSMWLPMGTVLGLDARFFSRQGFWRKRVHQTRGQLLENGQTCQPTDLSISNFATAALMIQLVLMYFFSGLAKCNEHWFSGQALEQALSWEFYVRPQADWIAGQSWLLRPITWIVLGVELALPLLVFAPGLFRWTRRPAAIFLIVMHLGIASLMTIGTFSAVAIAGWILFFGDVGRREGWSRFWRDSRDTAMRPGRVLVDSPRATATARDLLIGMALTMVVAWNFHNTRLPGVGQQFPASLEPAIYQLGLFQDFPMFAEPMTQNWKWVHQSRNSEDQIVNVYQKLVPPLGLPPRPPATWGSHAEFLWRQLHVNLVENQHRRPEFVERVRERLKRLEKNVAGLADQPSQRWLINGTTGEKSAW